MEMIPQDRVAEHIGWLEQVMEPARKWYPGYVIADQLNDLEEGWMTAWKMAGDVEGVIMVSMAPIKDSDAEWGMWIECTAAKVTGGPKERAQHMREVVGFFEKIARENKCRELHIDGRRGWRAVFPDYEARVSRDMVQLKKVIGDA